MAGPPESCCIGPHGMWSALVVTLVNSPPTKQTHSFLANALCTILPVPTLLCMIARHHGASQIDIIIAQHYQPIIFVQLQKWHSINGGSQAIEV